MIDYTKYHDKTIRNKPNPNREERAYAELQANEAVQGILVKYHDEPKFLQEVAYKLASHVINSNKED